MPQDGSFPQSARFPGQCAGLIVSTAVEDTVPDVRAARTHGIPIRHRSELLASLVEKQRSIAITGTSGKSTVTAMVFEILRGAGRDPSLITGGDLLLLREHGLLGNAFAGTSDLLVIEADESNGSLTRYSPWAGALLNLQRDHKEPEELAGIFATFRSRTRGPFILGEDPNLDPFSNGAIRFGVGPAASVRATSLDLRPEGSSFDIGVDARAWPQELGAPGRNVARFRIPIPGRHNVLNAAAAVAVALAAGIALEAIPSILSGFWGVARRFQRIGRARGCEVIDDFAHNPEKIRASLATARLSAPRILAVFQPHGFGPTRFLRAELIEAFAEGLGPEDRLYLPEIFYAGGTAARDISSEEIADAVRARNVPAVFARNREDLIPRIVEDASSGSCILVMGARDPSLTGFCREILRRLAGDEKED